MYARFTRISTRVVAIRTREAKSAGRPSRRLGRPVDVDRIIVTEPNGSLSPEQIYSLFTRATDWRPTADPRTPVALAVSDGWVFKSRLTKRSFDRGAVEEEVRRMIWLSTELRVWHPAKTWFVLHDRRRYLPCSATPLLVQASRAPFRRILGLCGIVKMLREVASFGLRLDPMPWNYGFSGSSLRLYYLDDEVYPLKNALLRSERWREILS
jgi:hypothetical protein